MATQTVRQPLQQVVVCLNDTLCNNDCSYSWGKGTNDYDPVHQLYQLHQKKRTQLLPW